MSRQFFRNAAFLMVVEIILKLKWFVFIPLLTRSFGTINYGVWSQVGVLVATLSPLMVFGTDSAIIRYLPGRPLEEQKRRYSAWCVFLLAISISVCSLLLLLKRPIVHLFFGESEEYVLYIPLAAATLFVTLAINVLRNWYRIHNNARIYGAILIIQALLNTAALVVMLVLHKGVYELVIYSLVADMFVAAWLAIHLTRDVGWARPDFSVIKSLVRYGIPIVPAGYAMWGLNSMDRLFLVKYSTMSEIGVYSLCYSLGFMIIQVFVSPIWNMYPNAAAELFNQNKMDELQRLFDRSVGIILLVAVPATVGMFVLGRQLLDIIATPEFSAGAPVMAIITSGYLLHMLSSYYDIALGLVHKQHLSTISILIAFCVNFILNFILIPQYSIMGAAVATGLGFFTQFIFSFTFASTYTELKTSFVFPAKILSLSLMMGAGIYLVTFATTLHGLIRLLFLVLVGVVEYALLLLCFRVVRLEAVKANFISLCKR